MCAMETRTLKWILCVLYRKEWYILPDVAPANGVYSDFTSSLARPSRHLSPRGKVYARRTVEYFLNECDALQHDLLQGHWSITVSTAQR